MNVNVPSLGYLRHGTMTAVATPMNRPFFGQSKESSQHVRADQVAWGDQLYVDRVGEFRIVTGISEPDGQGRLLIAYELQKGDPRTLSGNIAAYPDRMLTVIQSSRSPKP